MKKSRVIIVEDDLSVQNGLVGWLAYDYEIKCYGSAEEFLRAVQNFDFEDGIPTCILLDFQMPGMNGVELQEILKRMSVEFPIVFMSGNARQADVIDAWRGGAIDFLLKPFTPDQVSSTLKKLFTSISKHRLPIDPIPEEPTAIDIPIARREAQALLLLGKGHRQFEVAELMGISLRTVKLYRTNLKNKLGLYTPVEIARYCDRYRSQIEKISGIFQSK